MIDPRSIFRLNVRLYRGRTLIGGRSHWADGYTEGWRAC